MVVSLGRNRTSMAFSYVCTACQRIDSTQWCPRVPPDTHGTFLSLLLILPSSKYALSQRIRHCHKSYPQISCNLPNKQLLGRFYGPVKRRYWRSIFAFSAPFAGFGLPLMDSSPSCSYSIVPTLLSQLYIAFHAAERPGMPQLLKGVRVRSRC